jgi:hypothetical protein
VIGRWFLGITIEEGCFDVELVAFQFKVIDKREEDQDGVLVGNSRKELIEVNYFNLRVSLAAERAL